MKKLLLIDGHSILNRAFYGLPDLTNSEGLHTGAVYGFLSILFRLIDEEKPSFLVVAFDVHAPTFRHEIYPEYKGTRKPMPQELREQVPLLKEVLDSMRIRRIEKAGLEADDLLGTLAYRGEAMGMEVSLVSGDRDLLQIATDRILIRIPKTKSGKTEIEDYHAADVERVYGVTPEKFIELKALMGDSSDNIPGVPKVGEKTAAELMAQFGSLDGIYEHLRDITKKAVRESLSANRELADLSKVLATINKSADFELDITEAVPDGMFNEESLSMFRRLGFKNFLPRFDAFLTGTPAAGGGFSGSVTCRMITGRQQGETFVREIIDKCAGKDSFAGSFITADPAGVCLACEGTEAAFLSCDGDITRDDLGRWLSDISKECRLAGFDMKEGYCLYEPYGIDEEAEAATGGIYGSFDILIGSYILNPLKSDYAPEDIAQEHLGKTFISLKERFGKDGLKGAEKSAAANFAGDMAALAYQAAPVIEKKLSESSMLKLFREIEMPLSYILYDMEKTGITVQKDALKEYGDRLTGRIEELESLIYEAAGEKFNINSPKQLGEILFEKLGLPGGKKTKTGYSTAADVLEKIAPGSKLVTDILEYRALAKLKSTYADGLADYIEEDSRIHTSFKQTITATGRISSAEPNLQNIPMRTELGRLIRKVFVPREGWSFTDADYSQIELRILAHMSGDRGLIEAYHEGRDIHAITASRVFHVPFEEVTSIQRRNAKAVNFGIVYGISAFGLSENLDISREEAKMYMEEYLDTYPGVKDYQKRAVEDAAHNGYCVTLYGRRRPMPELKAGNYMQRQFGERVAMNAPIQGTAADIMKIAMIRVFRRLRHEGLSSRMILQIHDELLIETAPGEEDRVRDILINEMTEAARLSVPLEVDCHSGSDWYEAK